MPLRRARKSAEDPERLTERAFFLRDLAASLRAGLTLQEALASWASGRTTETARCVYAVCSLRLGPTLALRYLDPLLRSDRDLVILVARVHARLGGDLAALIEAVATEVEARADGLRAARAHTAGALASARTIAVLPLGGLAALGVLGGSPDGVDALLAIVGIGLGLAGFLWLDRLLPRPRPPRPCEAIPALLAVAVAAGVPLPAALDELARALDDADLRSARRAVRLGLTWHEALLRSPSEPLAHLGRSLHRRAAAGLPLGDTLDRHLRERRIAARRDHEAALRRAPVRMIVPLGLCVLPGFVLVTIGPLLRAILSHT